jgi:hypothetical protein
MTPGDHGVFVRQDGLRNRALVVDRVSPAAAIECHGIVGEILQRLERRT